MPSRTAILYADSGIAFGELANVFFVVLREQATVARLVELRRQLSRSHARWPGALCGLTVFGETSFAFNVPAEIRSESTAITRDFQSAAASLVVESSGFAGSALRAFLSGITLAASHKSKIHATVLEGATWLAPVASTLGKQTITASELVNGLEETRAAMKGR